MSGGPLSPARLFAAANSGVRNCMCIRACARCSKIRRAQTHVYACTYASLCMHAAVWLLGRIRAHAACPGAHVRLF
eukprot:4688538-Lingulodinium_polyedra.AAC.1